MGPASQFSQDDTGLSLAFHNLPYTTVGGFHRSRRKIFHHDVRTIRSTMSPVTSSCICK